MDSVDSMVVQKHEAGRFPRIVFSWSWLVVLPAAIWEIYGYYLPVVGGSLDRAAAWTLTGVIVLFAAVSLALHVAAHLGITWINKKELPKKITISIFGDVAQGWPSPGSGAGEILSAGAGLLMNLVLAGLFFLIWKTQTNNSVNLISLLLSLFNAWLFIINLIPAFPLDGGRVFRIILEGFGRLPGAAARWGRGIGLIVAAVLSGWAIFLILQHLRFSWETGLITFAFVLLLLEGLRVRPAGEMTIAALPMPKTGFRLIRIVLAGLTGLIMAAAASSLLLTNNSLEAPGVALSIGPMLKIPAQYRHPLHGQFFLVTVIDQSPITAGEWVLGKIDPAIRLTPPEKIIRNAQTPQQEAAQGFQMLNDSETTAIAVGLKLAGYNTAVLGKGVKVDLILEGSHANGILQPGDIITGLNGTPIHTTDELIAGIKAQNVSEPVRLSITRGGDLLTVDVPLMAPATPKDTPRLGIQIEQAGFDYKPPFPISIQTDKISGGPSAGLMFTLTVYNSLAPIDLAGGRKIAGTGTINLDGSVGPIGGVKQKIYAAESVGATYFLCPVENYADAVSVAKTIKVIKIATVEQAVAFLRSLPPQ